jgi:hypothetical protein
MQGGVGRDRRVSTEVDLGRRGEIPDPPVSFLGGPEEGRLARAELRGDGLHLLGGGDTFLAAGTQYFDLLHGCAPLVELGNKVPAQMFCVGGA